MKRWKAMLSPHERTSLFDALRPPPGAVLDAAVGTSFTLDLEALLTAPIAFALFEEPEEPSVDGVEPVGLLDSIRRYASRLTLFCQAGEMAVPERQRSVFAWLEEGVIEVNPRRAHRVFHPKVWVARYVDVGTNRRALRVLCATRNLTFDTSWDTLLVLDSAPFESTKGRVLVNQRPLAELLRTLPDLAKDPDSVSSDRRTVIDELAREVERAPLVPPEPFGELRFHALGLGSGATWPFPARAAEAVVISPFLGGGFLERFADRYPLQTLVSRDESLDRIQPELLRAGRLAVINPAADVAPTKPAVEQDAPAAVEPGRPFGGLHAKLYAFDVDDGSVVLTGSANATTAAFDGNVEVLVELRGPRSAGIEALMADTPHEVGLDDLLVDYRRQDLVDADQEVEALAADLERLRRAMASCTLRAHVEPVGDDYELRLTAEEVLPSLDVREVSATIWPVTLREEQSSKPLRLGEHPTASFTVTVEGLTSFFAVRVNVRSSSARLTTTFLVNALLDGAPDDRHSRLLAAMLRDPERLLRYLLLLLGDPESLGAEPGEVSGERWLGRWAGAGWEELPMLELLLRAVDAYPDRLDHIDQLLEDLGLERDRILPEGWASVWSPIWTYREQARS